MKELFSINKRSEIYSDERGYKKELFELHNIKSEWEKIFQGMTGSIRTRETYIRRVFSNGVLQLTGVVNTKAGLYYGIIMRDPTMDKRMLELNNYLCRNFI